MSASSIRRRRSARGGTNFRKLGADETESLERVPAQWKVVVHVREKFACRTCGLGTEASESFHSERLRITKVILFGQILCYGLVGILNTGITVTVIVLLTFAGVHPLIANATGFGAGPTDRSIFSRAAPFRSIERGSRLGIDRAVLLFLGGMQILSIGVLGEYIGKIYMEVKRRPRFIVEDTRSIRQRRPEIQKNAMGAYSQ